MIVVDASVVIAHLVSADVHHERAVDFFRTHLDARLAMHSLTMTEVLVAPSRAGRSTAAVQALRALGIEEWMPPPSSALRLAELRAQTALRLPDCCVLDAALELGAALATFDERLGAAASALGVEVPLA